MLSNSANFGTTASQQKAYSVSLSSYVVWFLDGKYGNQLSKTSSDLGLVSSLVAHMVLVAATALICPSKIKL